MVEVKDGCTIVLQEDNPFNYVCFDQRTCCVAKGSAGGFYEKLQQLAEKVRFDSEGKCTIELDRVEDGIITITNNLAIENIYSIQLVAYNIIQRIVPARAVH